MNIVKTGMLLAAMTALFLGVGYLIGGTTGALIALVIAIGTNAYAWWNSDKLALRVAGVKNTNEGTGGRTLAGDEQPVSVTRLRRRRTDGERIVDHVALEHHHFRAVIGEHPRRREPRDAAPDHHRAFRLLGHRVSGTRI